MEGIRGKSWENNQGETRQKQVAIGKEVSVQITGLRQYIAEFGCFTSEHCGVCEVPTISALGADSYCLILPRRNHRFC